jgi:hypothetical protein
VVFRSVSRGDRWEVISPDLTRGKPGPAENFGHTLTALVESPVKPGLLWAGSDDGRLHMSRNGGTSWIDLSTKIPDLPQERMISRIECSHRVEGTAYIAIDRHRNDDRRPYLFKTTDHGETWTALASNLPEVGHVHVVCEDPRNPSLVYAGTEFGLFVSLDGGKAWQRIGNGLPTVAVHDLVVHPRDRELVIATHGRGIWILEVAPLQELSEKVLAADVHLFDVKPALRFNYRGQSGLDDKRTYSAPNPPFGTGVHVYLKEKPKEPVKVLITDALGEKVAELRGTAEAGLQLLQWDLRRAREGGPGPVVPAGEYAARVKIGTQELAKKFRVEEEP